MKIVTVVDTQNHANEALMQTWKSPQTVCALKRQRELVEFLKKPYLKKKERKYIMKKSLLNFYL